MSQKKKKKKKKKLDFDSVFIELHLQTSLSRLCLRSVTRFRQQQLGASILKREYRRWRVALPTCKQTTAPHRVAPSIQMHKTTRGRRFRSGLEAVYKWRTLKFRDWTRKRTTAWNSNSCFLSCPEKTLWLMTGMTCNSTSLRRRTEPWRTRLRSCIFHGKIRSFPKRHDYFLTL